MPIVKCEASKATPMKGLAYIMDKEKTLVKGSIGFLSDDPEQMARQMMQTMHLHGKGRDKDERKYYHCKVSFDPQDLKANGGDLDERKANLFAARYAAKTWPGREVAWSVQHHGTAMHIHFIVAACEQETGKKLDARNAEYRRWKNQANDLAKEMGLSTLDWEKTTKEKRRREIQADDPISETFAEQGLKARGQTTWKDDLRERIDAALQISGTLAEFKAALQANGVELTRCTEQTISYKLGDHRACRGDTLGGDYTAEAIRNALDVNANQRTQGDAERVIDSAERALYRDLGRAAGVKRAEVDDMCAQAVKATWEEKQATWDSYRAAKEEFWNEYNARQAALRKELNAEYKLKKKLRAAQWAVDPRNRRKSLIGVLYALIVLSRNKPSDQVERHIEYLKEEQDLLRMTVDRFKRTTGESLEKLKERDLPLEEYMDAVKQLQSIADNLHEDFSVIQRKDLQRERDKIQKASRKPSLDDKISGAVQNAAPVKSSGKARKTPGRDR